MSDICPGCNCEECIEREVQLTLVHRDEERAAVLRVMLMMFRGTGFEASHAMVSRYIESESSYVRELVKGGGA